MFGGAVRECPGHFALDVVDAPIDKCAFAGVGIGQETEFVTTDVKAHVEGFVEIRRRAEEGAPPDFGGMEIRRGIDDGAKPVKWK